VFQNRPSKQNHAYLWLNDGTTHFVIEGDAQFAAQALARNTDGTKVLGELIVRYRLTVWFSLPSPSVMMSQMLMNGAKPEKQWLKSSCPNERRRNRVEYALRAATLAVVLAGFLPPSLMPSVGTLAKAMIKQIDSVINDLRNQVVQFKRGGGRPICVAIVGINAADRTVGYEGDRPFPTTGRGGFLHPIQEAPEAERRLREQAAPEFDEFLVLRFKATNEPPYPFDWVNYNETRLDYAAALSRISARYQQRF
jgi:hypothetical protein